MSKTTRDPLILAVEELRILFPEFRFGQLVACLLSTAGGTQPSDLYDMEDEQILATAQAMVERHRGRQSAYSDAS